MSDKDEIKDVLKEGLQDGAEITERQLDKAAEEVSKLPYVDESDLREIGEKTVGHPDTSIFESEDLGDINDVLDNGKP